MPLQDRHYFSQFTEEDEARVVFDKITQPVNKNKTLDLNPDLQDTQNPSSWAMLLFTEETKKERLFSKRRQVIWMEIEGWFLTQKPRERSTFPWTMKANSLQSGGSLGTPKANSMEILDTSAPHSSDSGRGRMPTPQPLTRGGLEVSCSRVTGKSLKSKGD